MKNLIFAYAFLFFPIIAVAAPSYQLPSGEWRMISLPASPPAGASTVGAVLGDNILPQGYGEKWILYTYDSTANKYTALTLESPLEQGRGYWIIQLTGQVVTLDLPADSADVPSGYSTQMTSSQNGAVQWNLLGYSFSSAGTLGDFAVQSTGGACSNPPCDINQAKAEGLFENRVWIWANNAYSALGINDSLVPWQGFWAATLENSSGQSLKLIHKTTHGRSKHFAVGYLTPWNMTPADFENVDDLYTHVILSFARADAAFNGNWGDEDTTGLIGENSTQEKKYKAAIKKLQGDGVKVLLAVGGGAHSQNYPDAWRKLAAEYTLDIANTTHKKALVNIIKYLDLDGIDIDYEMINHLPITEELINEYAQVILTLKEVVNSSGDNKLLTMTGGASGAECSSAMVSNRTLGCNKVSPLGYKPGLERRVFKKLIDQGKTIESLFDLMTIMTYDNLNRDVKNKGEWNFISDPVIAHQHFREIYKGPLAIGLNTAKEGYGDGLLVATTNDAKKCEFSSMLHPFIEARRARLLPASKAYSLERFIDYLGPKSNVGIMVWNLSHTESNENKAAKSHICEYNLNLKGLNEYVNEHFETH